MKWALQKHNDVKQEQINYILEGLEMGEMNNNYFWYKDNHYIQTKGVAMEAKYVPSVVNIFMNRWKEEQIYSIERPNLKSYRSYIDDIVIIWQGTEELLQEFFDEINQNIYEMSFPGNWSKYIIDYLDIQIYKENRKLNTRT